MSISSFCLPIHSWFWLNISTAGVYLKVPWGHPNILIFSSALYNYHAKKWWYHTLWATHGLPSREVGKGFLLCFPLISSGTVLVTRFWDNCLMGLTAISHFPSVQSCCCQNSSNPLLRSLWWNVISSTCRGVNMAFQVLRCDPNPSHSRLSLLLRPMNHICWTSHPSLWWEKQPPVPFSLYYMLPTFYGSMHISPTS